MYLCFYKDFSQKNFKKKFQKIAVSTTRDFKLYLCSAVTWLFHSISFGRKSWVKFFLRYFTANIYLLKVNSRNTTKRCEICSKLTIKIPERRLWRRSGVLIVNFEQISHLFLLFLLLTLNSYMRGWFCEYIL